MALTKKMTRGFKEKNCASCKAADKKALKNGREHCSYPGIVSIKNGICLAKKRK